MIIPVWILWLTGSLLFMGLLILFDVMSKQLKMGIEDLRPSKESKVWFPLAFINFMGYGVFGLTALIFTILSVLELLRLFTYG